MAAVVSDLCQLLRLTSPAWRTFCRPSPRCYHRTACLRRDIQAYETEKKLTNQSKSLFDVVGDKRPKDKIAFQAAVDVYIAKETVYRRGHVEFIYAALDKMKEYGVHRDLSVYSQLLEVFPPTKMMPKSAWQVELMHFPRQQQCAIDLMEQMEQNGVLPDHKFGSQLAKIFGQDAHAFRKYRRIMYWLPKFRNANPYPVPYDLPSDPVDLAVLALKRMAVDLENAITVWKTTEVEEEPVEDTFIASAISPQQQRLISSLDPKTAVFVEGGFPVWTRQAHQTYFFLRADSTLPPPPVPRRNENGDEEGRQNTDLFDWKLPFFGEEEGEDPALKQLIQAPSVHEQTDGTVLAMCITGTGTKDSLVSWIRCLQRDNPTLEHIPVVFTLRSPEGRLQVTTEPASQPAS